MPLWPLRGIGGLHRAAERRGAGVGHVRLDGAIGQGGQAAAAGKREQHCGGKR
jgi:hypothetical protein